MGGGRHELHLGKHGVLHYFRLLPRSSETSSNYHSCIKATMRLITLTP
ncbi:MAG: hypothetical protein ACI9BH_001435, partial [Paracoccaceae bacterium]